MTKTYEVKCSDCRTTVRTTTEITESYAGTTCAKCRPAPRTLAERVRIANHNAGR